jgi:uncharacterized protein (TIGR02646 family)
MIQLPAHIKPATDILEKLKRYQDEIDALPTFEQQSEKAKNSFSAKNKKSNKVFDSIKISLSDMCSGARRCAYCEDSVGDEVEHIHPKNLYPEYCFHWNNYVYACGPCNGPKNDKFAVFRADTGAFEEVNPPAGTKAVKPPAGSPVMINPRSENPLDYCMLDLSSTFKFVIVKAEGSNDAKRADYTFNTVLRLNEREYLRKARKNAYANYKARLYQYTTEKEAGASQHQLDSMMEGIKSEAHPTVWQEMKRYHQKNILSAIDKDLNNLFFKSPESLQW